MGRDARQLLQVTALVLRCAGAATATPAPEQDARLGEAQVAQREAAKLEEAGRYREAIPKAERALALREAVLGKGHLAVAESLHLLATLDHLQGRYGSAEPLFRRALAIREVALGVNHPDVATSLYGLAALYCDMALYDRAEPLFQRALTIREATLGKHHPDYATSLGSLADQYADQGLLSQAEALHRQALAIREATLGKGHPDVARSLRSLADVSWGQGKLELAEQLSQQALTILEAALGENHPEVAKPVGELVELYTFQGLYDRAERLGQRLMSIREATLGKDHPDFAGALNDVAMISYFQGRYDRAEPLLHQALSIVEAALGPHHPMFALCLNNLANIYREQGLYGRAEPLYLRALAIREETLDKRAPAISQGLYNLASIYREQGRYDLAEPLLERALAIQESSVALSHLSDLYLAQGRYDRAESTLSRLIGIQETVFGKNHPWVARSRNTLALVYLHQGKYDRAGPLFEEALAVRETILGGGSPEVAQSLNGLGQLRLRQRRLSDAVTCFSRALAISEGRLRREALDFSGPRLTSFLQFLDGDAQRLYSLARAHPDDANVRRLALTSALLLKGRSVEEAGETSRTILRSLGPQDRDAFERLRGLRTRLAKLSLSGPGNLPPAEYAQQLKSLEDEGDALEAALAVRSAPLRALSELPSAADVQDRVAAALPPDGVLVELIAYRDAAESDLRAQPRYLAMALFPDGRTGAVDLGPAGAIDAAVSRLREALGSQEAAFRGAAQKLHQLAFRPLLPILRKTRKVFLALDGQLSLVPFAALHDGRRFLVDTFDFTYLNGGRELLPRPGEKAPTAAPSVVVFADPDYGKSSPPERASSPVAERSYSVERFLAENRAGLSAQRWTALPGTRQEAETIHALLPRAQLFLGAEASKERLLHLSAPGILHIATHGFFLEDATAPPGARGLAAVGSSLSRSPDPLLRSGLAMAGPPSDPGNSLVTALELAGLDLWGTRLVVLSACDTGRGDVKVGQGVFGLRRALWIAGAEAMVVSLWKVDDETTRAMMGEYYRNLQAGQGRAGALKQAMLSVRARYPHPHFWAPFIALGRDTPLPGLARPGG